ncbi:hypothetical protein AAG906_010076 [Vitis piasezkii]
MEKKRAKSHEKVEMRRMNNEEDRWFPSQFSPKWEPFSFGHLCINMCNSKSRSYKPWNHVQLYHLISKQLAMAMEECHAKEMCFVLLRVLNISSIKR